MVNRGSRGIYYCNGSTVVNADTASISTPIAINDGGTGATTASGARINLGGTTVGIAVFTAANATAGRMALAAAASGANSDITSLTGLTTPLSIAQGGTGQITASAAFNALSPITTAGDIILGNGANSATRLGIGSNGTALTSDGTTASWTIPTAPVPTIPRSARTSNTVLAAADQGKFTDITSGTFAQTYNSAASLAAGWFNYIGNNGPGTITLTANGSETIGSVNAATTAILSPGQSAVVSSDGSNLYFPVEPTGFRNMEVFNSTGTFTPKPGVVRYWIEMKGAGGGGCGSSNTSFICGGGGEGGVVRGFVDLTSGQTVTIGTGGASSTGGATATTGGNSTFGAMATANGGLGGGSSIPGLGGSGTFSTGLVERGAPGGLTGSGTIAAPGGGRGGGTSGSGGSPDGVMGGGGAGGANSATPGTGGDGYCIVMW